MNILGAKQLFQKNLRDIRKTKMLNKSKLKISVDTFMKIGGAASLVRNFEQYKHIYGIMYIKGLLCAMERFELPNRKAFERQRDYQRYINGYNNGKHIIRCIDKRLSKMK